MEPSDNNRFEKNITVEKKKKKLLLSFTAESGYGYVLKRLSGKKRRTREEENQSRYHTTAHSLLPVHGM